MEMGGFFQRYTMMSAFRLGEGVGGTCIGLHRVNICGEEVGFSTSVPLPVLRAGRGRGKGCTGAQAYSAQAPGHKKQGSFSRNLWTLQCRR